MKKTDFFKLQTGKTLRDLPKPQPLEKTLERRIGMVKSRYPLRTLGQGVEGELIISEEQRADHMHIIGTTRRGKSKFIEYLIREDIDRGTGVCLIDPSENGDTMYNVLEYCISKNYTKVCLIDPHTIEQYGKVTCIQPFHYEQHLPSYKDASVENIKDTIKVLFGIKTYTETPIVNKYLTAVLNVLYNARMTLHEARYFAEYEQSYLRRSEILEKSYEFDWDRLSLEEAFKSYTRFEKDVGSTTRRLEPFLNSSLDLIFGANRGIDFQKMISEGWVLLVNASAGRGVNKEQTVILASAVINELVYAMDKMINSGWSGVYYLYIDEAGRYANRNLADLLAYKGKTGLRITCSHQYFNQFEDKYILDAVKQIPKIKIMFDTPNYHDRMEMIRLLGYGGDIPHEAAAYANKGLPKQEMVIAVGNDAPKRIRVPDVARIEIDRDTKEKYIAAILMQDWCHTPPDIRQQMRARFTDESIYSKSRSSAPKQHTPAPRARAVSDRKADQRPSPPRRKSLLDDKD